jgi:TonB family protein
VSLLRAEKAEPQNGAMRLKLGGFHLDFALAPGAMDDIRDDLRHRRDTAWGLLLGSIGAGKSAGQFVTVHESVPLYSPVDEKLGASLGERVKCVEDLVLGWSLSQQLPVRPVGFYVVCSREEQAEVECELPALKRYGRDQSPFVLCIRPAGAVEAAPVVVADANHGEVAELAVPLDFSPVVEDPVKPEPTGPPPAISSRTQPSRVPPVPVAPRAAASQAAPVASPAAAIAAKAKSVSWLSIALALTTVFLVVVVLRLSQTAGLFSPTPPPAATATPDRLDLQIGRKGGDLEITWNRNTPVVQSAQRGFLYIMDGKQRTQVFLEEGHLKTGRVLYVPQASDLEVRLEVVTPEDRIVRESLKVIVAGGGSTVPTGPPTTRAAARDYSSRDAAEPSREAAEAADSAAVDSASDQPRRVFVAPPDRRSTQPVGTARIEPIPDAAVPVALSAGPTMPQTPITRPAPPVSAPAPVEQAQTAIELSRSNPPASQTGASSLPTYEAPVPLRKPTVWVPPFVRSMMRAEVAVPVTVMIDANGKVTEARVARQSSSVGSYLSSIARRAAEQWKFKPALRSGKPVATEFTLLFRFNPGSGTTAAR